MVIRFSSGMMALLFVGTLFFSLFHMSANTGLVSETTGCPFMTSGEVVCTMNLDEHLTLWRLFSLASPLVLLIILLLATFTRPIYISCSILFGQVCKVWELTPCDIPIWQLMYIRVVHHLQESFSQGILHPKLF